MQRVEDLCHSCIHFDSGNYECAEGHYLEGESDMVTIECEDYDKHSEENK